MADHAADGLSRLAAAVGLTSRVDEIQAVTRFLMEPWGQRPIGDLGGWHSDVADDGSPYEYSFVVGAPEPEVRILVETQTDSPSLAARWEAAVVTTERIASQYGVDISRFKAIQDLFEPRSESGFAIWHSVVFRGTRPPEFKLYLDAQAQGRFKAPALMEEALHRLGFVRAWHAMLKGALRRGPRLDEARYLSLDLSNSPSARVKLYVRHFDASAADAASFLGPNHPLAKTAPSFLKTLGGGLEFYDRRPFFSCHAFVDPESPESAAKTIYFPVESYASDEGEIEQRALAYLAERQVDSQMYTAAIDAAERPSSAERRQSGTFTRTTTVGSKGLHSYVGLREEASGPRLTFYLSPNVLGNQPSRPMTNDNLPAATEIVRRFEQDEVLQDHPFLRRLAREPVNIGHLWLVMANFWYGVVHDFPKRLSHIAAKVDDDRIRCIVTKQLHDELGEGDFSKAHKAMFRNLVSALEPYRLPGDDDVLMAPGRRFSERLGQAIFAEDSYESVGALMLIEIYGKQVDVFMANQFRRQNSVDAEALKWLHLHENLEVDHADDSLTLAHLIPEHALAATWRGAETVVSASREYFDSLYRLAFP